MMNEEAIKLLKDGQLSDSEVDAERFIEAYNIAIKALETVSCIKEKCAYCPHCENCDVDDETLEIKALEQQEKTGKWIMEDMFDGDVAYRCSECNELFWIESGTPKDNEYNFCPNCGAKMII